MQTIGKWFKNGEIKWKNITRNKINKRIITKQKTETWNDWANTRHAAAITAIRHKVWWDASCQVNERQITGFPLVMFCLLCPSISTFFDNIFCCPFAWGPPSPVIIILHLFVLRHKSAKRTLLSAACESIERTWFRHYDILWKIIGSNCFFTRRSFVYMVTINDNRATYASFSCRHKEFFCLPYDWSQVSTHVSMW